MSSKWQIEYNVLTVPSDYNIINQDNVIEVIIQEQKVESYKGTMN